VTQANPSAGLVGSSPGLTEQSPGASAPRPRVFQVWATINGSRICVFAAPDADAALLWARDQIRHGGDSRCTRVEVRAISDAGTKVIWESQ
jgi:hypothetical protein